MQRVSELGKWITEKFRSQLAFSEKLGVHQGSVSNWLKGSTGISLEYQAKIRKLGYQGPWPQEEPQEPAAPAGGPYVTEREFGKLEGTVESHEKEIRRLRRRLQEAFVLIQDLGRQAGIELPPQEPVE